MKTKLVSVMALILAACGGGGQEYCVSQLGNNVSCNNTAPSTSAPASPFASSTPPSISTAPAPTQAPPATAPSAPATQSAGATVPVVNNSKVEPAPVIGSTTPSMVATPPALAPDGYAWGFVIQEVHAPEPLAQVCKSLDIVVYGNTMSRVELVSVNDVRRTYGDFDIIFHDTRASYHSEIASAGWVTAKIVAYDPYGKAKEVMGTRSWYLNPNC